MSKKNIIAVICISMCAGYAPAAEIETRKNITYAEPGGTKLQLDAYLPKAEGTYPAVLCIHGGAWKKGSRNAMRDYATALANRGMACFTISYRLAPQHKFPAQIDDCRSAVLWVREHAADYKVNPEKIGAIGFSAGGHLTALLATTGSVEGGRDTRIQAAAAGGAPTDFRVMPMDNGRWARYWMGGDFSEVPEKFHAASPTAFVDKDDPPIIFFNGTADKTVPLRWTEPCYDALKRAGVKTELFKVEGAGHGQTKGNPKAKEAAFSFLERELK